MKGKETTDTIIIVSQMQEKFRSKAKELYFGFVDFKKAFDRVLTEVIRWAMYNLGVEEWLVSAVMSIYTGAKTVVGTVYGNSSGFEIKVGMQQGSSLSPLLFVIVMKALCREFRVSFPWEFLYTGDLVVIAETDDDLTKRLNQWKDNVENRGMRVNMNKTKVMISGEQQKVTWNAVRWPCGVYGRGVGNNSIQCTSCKKWVHRKCSDIEGSRYKVMKTFICRGCKNPVTGTGWTSVDIGVNANLELVNNLLFR